MEHLLVSGVKIYNGHQGFYDAPVIPFQHAETLTTKQLIIWRQIHLGNLHCMTRESTIPQVMISVSSDHYKQTRM